MYLVASIVLRAVGCVVVQADDLDVVGLVNRHGQPTSMMLEAEVDILAGELEVTLFTAEAPDNVGRGPVDLVDGTGVPG